MSTDDRLTQSLYAAEQRAQFNATGSTTKQPSPERVAPTEVEVCLGCGCETAKRDCGCPAGTAMKRVAPAPAEPGDRICPECGGLDGMHVRRACRGVVPEPAPEACPTCESPKRDEHPFVDIDQTRVKVCGDPFHQEPAGAQEPPTHICTKCGRLATIPPRAQTFCECGYDMIPLPAQEPAGAQPHRPLTLPADRGQAIEKAAAMDDSCISAGTSAGAQPSGAAELPVGVHPEVHRLCAALASAQQERDHNWQCFTTQLAEYRKVVEERDSAQAQIATLTIQRNGTLLALEDAQAQIAALTARAEQRQCEAFMAGRNGQVDPKAGWWMADSDGHHDAEAYAAWLAASTPAADTPTQKKKEIP